MQRGKTPYYRLGQRLQQIRRQLRESITEVSGAVELEADIITSYEKGETRPSEDVLGMLMSHFDIKDDEADELWELAGYVQQEPMDVGHDTVPQPTLVVIPVDNKIVYTDTANVSVNNYGVVLNFMQAGPNNQQIPVARVGMSIEHAKSVLDVLGRTIAQAQAPKKPKQLPGSTNPPV